MVLGITEEQCRESSRSLRSWQPCGSWRQLRAVSAHVMEVERGLALASGEWYAVDRCETEDGMQVVPGSGMTLEGVLVG